jgi:hypothetical protein
LNSGIRFRLQQVFQFRALPGDEQFCGGRIQAQPSELANSSASSPVAAVLESIFS